MMKGMEIMSFKEYMKMLVLINRISKHPLDESNVMEGCLRPQDICFQQ